MQTYNVKVEDLEKCSEVADIIVRISCLVTMVRKYIENESRHLKGAQKLNLLEKGQRVEHAILGAGTILDINLDEESYLVQFDGMATPRQIAMKVRLKVL